MKPPPFVDWVSHDCGIQVDSAEQLFRIISHIAMLAQNRTYAWRGQNDASWPLWSSLYRRIGSITDSEVDEETVRSAEMDILKEARRWGLGRDLGSSASDMHMLASLQHHGLPTRLIDVTANPMTALWFATEQHRPDEHRKVRRSPGVLFAIDVTNTPWHETFQHGSQSYEHLKNPLAAAYNQALDQSQKTRELFRIFPALPDERMKAQEGFFLGSSVPKRHKIPGILGFNPIGAAPGAEKLRNLLRTERGQGRPANLPFCAIVIPPGVKDKLRDPLKRTYNRRRRVLFPDIDGFREGFYRDQLD